MKHRWMGLGPLVLALGLTLALGACAPSQGGGATPGSSAGAPATQAASTTAPPSQTDDGAPATDGSYDY